MSNEVPKLNSMRLLEAQNIEYEVCTYDETIRDGIGAAAALDLSPEQVYKTLIVEIKGNEYVLVMIASDRTLDLKRFARSIGQKKASMPTKRGAEAVTGLKTGGIGALALAHKRWGVYLDKPAEEQGSILANAGRRGVNLKVKVADLVSVLNAKVVEVTDPPDGSVPADEQGEDSGEGDSE